ncbi:hypothetical protein BDM02DRAFT_3247810 [Thelephora ganbajun]|uniref:Uncharacterized protein n=1 Tax=Thelephora ganbajun TaxID=370292 RepID=A0ACB6ZCW1_THEGA|nr:hypothetical protein BDM02DRAFT_3247810 [Thelephora ganbajun]
MAILGGLFSKKGKFRSKPPSSITSSAVTDIDVESFNEGSEYDHSRLHPNTIYQNAAASSSKMKLPFRRSKSKVNLAATDTPFSTNLANTSPQFSTQSESPHSPLTPPQKSAVFSGYGDSGNALSTKSLPNVNHTRSESHETVKIVAPASAGKKSAGGLFSWARDRKKSKAPPPPPPSEVKEESFNLRAFRHVGGPDTAPCLDDTTTLLELPPARPRPRGDSVASDSSQRVSVAAFREMQARRSQAGSPNPQSTSRPSTQVDNLLRSGSPSLKPPASSIPTSHNQPRGRSVAPRMVPRTSTLRSSPSNSKSDSGSDSDHGPSPLSVQWRSRSELGHSSLPDHRPSNGPSATTNPQLRQEKSISDVPGLGKKPPMPTSVHAPARPAAIQSRSSSRPPIRNVPTPAKDTPRRPVKDSDASDASDDSSDDDDAPLATLVQPRRPGSAMSNTSGRSLPPKPLIDIKSLNNSPLSNSPAVSSVDQLPAVRSTTPTSVKNDMRPPTNINERLSNLTQGLTRPKPTSTVVSESIVKTDSDKISPVITGRTVPSRSMTAPPIVVPSVEKKSPVIDKDSSLAPKPPTYPTPSDSASITSSVNTTEFPLIKNPRTSLSLDDPTPIKPMPIHHRIPQSGFSVMSRPQHHSTSSASISTLPSPTSTQKQVEKEAEPLDFIGDFTAAMFSQFDLDLTLDEGRGSLDSTITKGVTTTTTAKLTTASSAVSSKPTTPASGSTIRVVNPLSKLAKKELTAATRPARSGTPPPQPPISVSESTTSSGRSFGRPRSSTLTTSISSQPPQSPDDEPQPRSVSRSQSSKPAKSIALDVPGTRKSTMSSQAQLPPPMSRHKRVPSTTSTSSESSYESSSSASSIAPKKQKQPQPQPQLRPQQAAQRPRSSTMSTLITANPPSPTKSSTKNSSSPAFNRPPQRPFAMRDNSPSSSTGDSSSGRLPVTPRDGSEIGSELGRGVRGKQQTLRTTESFGVGNDGLLSASNSEMGLKARKVAHRKSASYDDSTLKGAIRSGSGVVNMGDEERRRERRRSEAKNAIELGKVMNGNIKLDDDDDPTMGMNTNTRMGVMNPMMGMGPMGMGMGMGMPQQTMPMMMGNPWMTQPNPMLQQFMPPPPQSTDPQLLAAHQHAMMLAKQAYQLAVAQQAMQVAGDEWERGSTLGWPSSASTVMFPAGPRSMYAGSIYGGSEYGGPMSGWTTSSVYGGGFGPSTSNRNSVMMRNYQQSGPPPSRNSRIDLSSTNSPEVRQPRPRVKTGPDAPDRPIAALMQQQQKGRGRTPPPPSSWKRGEKS